MRARSEVMLESLHRLGLVEVCDHWIAPLRIEERRRPHGAERRCGHLLVCRYSLLGLQNALTFEAFDEVVPIPIAPERVLSGEVLKLAGDDQGPTHVARGSYLLEA